MKERDDKLGGHMVFAFFLVGAPVSILVGLLADALPKRRSLLFAWTVLLGEGACFATYFTTTYSGLFVTRVLTGISVGGALPIIHSLLGDLYEAERRSIASANVSLGMGIGIALGQGIAGFLGPIYGWRSPFLVVSVPAMFVAVLVLLFVKDPVRGAMEKAIINRHRDEVVEDEEKENFISSVHEHREQSLQSAPSPTCGMESFLMVIKTPTIVLLLLQGAPGCIPWGIVNVFLADYLAQEGGMSVKGATATSMVFGAGVFIGILSGGYLGSKLYKTSVKYPPLLGGTASILGCVSFYILINTLTSQSKVSYMVAISLLTGCLVGVTGPIVKSTLSNVTLPKSRGLAFALMNTFDDFGRGLGPVFISMMINYYDGDRRAAFTVGTAGWLLCGFFNLLCYSFVENDECKVQNRVIADF